MDALILLARLVLAAVFAVAGFSKLADRAGTRQGIADFGVPQLLARPAALLLPLAELAVAAALLPAATAWWGALGALVLLGLFVAGIAGNLARGRRPDCHCFGQIYSRPIGRGTLIRNGGLALIAAFVAVQGPSRPGPGAVEWLAALEPLQAAALLAFLALGLVVVLEGWLIAHLLRQHGRLLIRVEQLEAGVGGEAPAAGSDASAEPAPVEGLPVGAPAPAFSLPGLYGETLTLDALRARGRPVLLAFTSPTCAPCNALLPEIGRWQAEHAPKLTVAVISRGDVESNRAKAGEHGLLSVLLQQGMEVMETYESKVTPSAVLVNADGTVGSALAQGGDAIRALVAGVVGEAAAPSSAAATAPAAAAATVRAAEADGHDHDGHAHHEHQHDHDHEHQHDHDGHAHANSNGNGSAPASRSTRELPVAARAIPSVGDPAPTVRLPDLRGRTVNLAGMRGSDTLVLFWSTTCGFCNRMLPELKAWEADPPEGAPKLLVVSKGTTQDNLAQGLRSTVVLDQDFAVGRSFGATGTPSAVLVDREGRIASELAVGATQVMALARGEKLETGGGRPKPPGVGEPAPSVVLPDLSGKTVSLADFKGDRTAVVFWNPGCGFCSRMVDDVRAWEADPPAGAPRALFVSTGTVEANQALGFRSPVVLDTGFSTGTAFGASGTPMAVLLDEEGRIASGLAAGAPAVLELLGATQPTRP